MASLYARISAKVVSGALLAGLPADDDASRRRDRAAGTRHPAGPVSRDALAVAIGVAVWGAFAFALHGWLIGVRPFG